jgi:LysM domain-containing protein
MSLMSVGQRPEATGDEGAAGTLTASEQTADRHDDRGRPELELYTLSRLERELRSSRAISRELRAHGKLTGELRARGKLAGELRPGVSLTRPRRADGPQGVRLTRRGRRVIAGFVAAVALAVAAALWLAAATGAQAANHGVAPSAIDKSMTAVIVKPGQTLWSIALRAEPAADPRLVIGQIVEFNALGSDVVVPGERLWVPKS